MVDMWHVSIKHEDLLVSVVYKSPLPRAGGGERNELSRSPWEVPVEVEAWVWVKCRVTVSSECGRSYCSPVHQGGGGGKGGKNGQQDLLVSVIEVIRNVLSRSPWEVVVEAKEVGGLGVVVMWHISTVHC